MPTYEYRCENGHSFEATQRMADDPLTTCEVCSAPVQRVMYAPAVHFKGSGFYNTDYGTKKRARELKEAGEGKSSDGGSSEKSESKGAGGESSDKSSESSPKNSDGASSPAKKSDPKPAPAKQSD